MYKLLSMKNIAKQLNARTYTEYFYRFNLMARSLFKWENLPNGMEDRWIERFLFWEGNCIFFNDPLRGFMVAKAAETGKLNYYNDPTKVRPIFVNDMPYEGPQLINGQNCVVIRNNDDMLPTAPTMQFYAFKIANIERAIDVNIAQQKTPLIIQTTDKQRLSLKNAIDQRDVNEHVIFVDKAMDMESLKTLNTTAPIVFDKLELQKHMVYNECMTFLGVNNANMDKRERVQSAEVAANDEQIQANNDVMLKARQQAAENINRLFGLDVSVRRRSNPTWTGWQPAAPADPEEIEGSDEE